MVACDIAELDLPERVRRIIDRIGAPTPCCGYCRQPGAPLRCSRCKCVKYCGVECQRGHFTVHKGNCKSIDKKRKLVEKNWADEKPLEARSDDVIDAMTDLSLTHLTTTTTIEFADLLVRVGYRESDTVANGMLYYHEALCYYLMPMKLLGEVYHQDYSWVEDRAVLMMVILGGDESHTKAWFTESGSKRALNYRPSGSTSHTISFDIMGYEIDDLPFQALLLLSHLKLSEDYGDNCKRLVQLSRILSKENRVLGQIFEQHIQPFLLDEDFFDPDLMSRQLQQILIALMSHDNFLGHLKETIPLKPCHAPKLFSPASYNQDFFPGVADVQAPSELWMIYQDSFFENGLVQYLPAFGVESDED